jgi:iron complex outermembrane receptor protein
MLLGTQGAGDDPTHQVSLRSAWDLPHNIQFDIDARYIGVLPNPAVPAYVSFGSRIDWHAMDHIDLVLSGANLGGSHREFGAAAGGIIVGPSFLLTLQWRS